MTETYGHDDFYMATVEQFNTCTDPESFVRGGQTLTTLFLVDEEG